MSDAFRKIILADDLIVYRAGLAEVLTEEPDFVVVEEIGDCESLLEAIGAHDETLIVWAARMKPDVRGLVASARAARSRTVVLTEPADCAQDYLSMGVDAAVPRDFDGAHLMNVLRGLSVQEMAFAPQRAAASDGQEQSECVECGVDLGPGLSHLTPKEMKILALVVAGCNSGQIATKLMTPEQAIKNYIRALLATTGASDLMELAQFTRSHRLLEVQQQRAMYS